MSKTKNDGHLFFIILIVLVGFLSFWLTKKASALSSERKQFSAYYNSKKAYYMARSGFEHFLLKLNTALGRQSAYISALKSKKNNEQKKIICSAFIQDIIIPPGEKNKSERLSYCVSACDVLSSGNAPGVALRVTIEGSFADKSSSLSRLVAVK